MDCSSGVMQSHSQHRARFGQYASASHRCKSCKTILFYEHVNNGIGSYEHVNNGIGSYEHVNNGIVFYEHVNKGIGSYEHVNNGIGSCEHVNNGIVSYEHVNNSIATLIIIELVYKCVQEQECTSRN